MEDKDRGKGKRPMLDLNQEAEIKEEDEFEYLNPFTFGSGLGEHDTTGVGEIGETARSVNYNDMCFENIRDNDVNEMEFETVKDAETFYLFYARATGFGIRKSYRRIDKKGFIRYRAWVCDREGKREAVYIQRDDKSREPKAVTRVKCPACLRIRYSGPRKKYIVSQFIGRHTHRLGSPASVQFMRYHRKATEADYSQAKSLRRVGVKTSQIMRLAALHYGGYENVPYTQKDLYNKMTNERAKEIVGGNAEAAIAYLAGKKDLDANTYFNYCVDDEGRLTRIFWANFRAKLSLLR